jgi:hypothetical protein
LSFVYNAFLCPVDEGVQAKSWVEDLNDALRVEDFELNNVFELGVVDLRVGGQNDIVEGEIAHKLESEEQTPQVIHAALQEDLGYQLHHY